MWSNRQGSNLKHRAECADYWDHCRRCQRQQRDRCMPQTSQEPPQRTTIHDIQQWEQMRAFHSSSHLWPATVRPNPAGKEGHSPLVWTTLYPPLGTARLQTYVWDGHLDNFMPWTVSTPDRVTRPPLISHAQWNLRKGSNLQQPRSMETESNDPYSPQQSRAPSPQHSVLAHQSNGSTPPKTPYSAVRSPTLLPPAPPMKTTMLNAPSSISCARAAILIYLFFTLQSSNMGYTEKLIPSSVTWYWNQQPRPLHFAKSWKSCYRWTMTIIQRAWDTAWDLTTHRNVERWSPGRGQPIIQWTVTFYLIPPHRIPSLLLAPALPVL